MKIVLVAPLFPPEIGGSAPYAKELAHRLSQIHSITIIALAEYPEKVSDVRIVAVSKHSSRVMRILRLTKLLIEEGRNADIVYVLNGASSEFAASIVSVFSSRPFILGMADTHASESGQHSFIERLARARASFTVESFPLRKPEILPLEPYPEHALNSYEKSWAEHIKGLETIFNHVTH